MKTIIRLIKVNIIIKMSRKESFLFSLIGNILLFFLTYQLWYSIYSNSLINDSADFEYIILKLFLAMGLSSLVTTNIEWFISRNILSGDIQKYLILPQKFYNLKIYEASGTLLCNLFTNTIPLLLFIFLFFNIQLNISILYFCLSCIISFLIIFNIDLLVGITSFYTEAIWGISTIKASLIAFFAGAVIPIEIMPDSMQKIIQYSPFYSIFQTPISILLSNSSLREVILLILPQVSWCIILMIISKTVLKYALKKITINGG